MEQSFPGSTPLAGGCTSPPFVVIYSVSSLPLVLPNAAEVGPSKVVSLAPPTTTVALPCCVILTRLLPGSVVIQALPCRSSAKSSGDEKALEMTSTGPDAEPSASTGIREYSGKLNVCPLVSLPPKPILYEEALTLTKYTNPFHHRIPFTPNFNGALALA